MNADRETKNYQHPQASLNRRSGWQEWASLLLMSGMLSIAIYSIEQSQWINPQPSLMLIFGLAIVASVALGKSPLPAVVTHLLSLAAGSIVIIWRLLNLLPQSETLRSALQSLWWTVRLAQPNQSTLHFAIFLAIFTWLVAYIATWHLLRKGNAWLGVLLGAAAILVNLSNLSEEHYGYFLLYLLMAGLLIGQSTLAKQYHSFRKIGARCPGQSMIGFMASVLFLSIFAITGSWVLPEIRANHLQTLINTKNLEKVIDNHHINIFAAVPAKWSVLRNEYQDQLSFTPPNLSKEVQFVITADKPLAYWRTRRYDVYNSWGWTSSRINEIELKRNTPATGTEMAPNRTELTYKVTSKIKTDVLLTIGEFISSDIPVALHQLNPSQGDIVAVSSQHLLKPNDSYSVRTVLNNTTPAELSQAGLNYAQNITAHYLQLPPDLPRRVRSMSQTITRNARTPYDKAVAIVKFLARFSYVSEGTVPPTGSDAVEYFLTTSQSGNCNNFASAMVVMLRVAGVPARLSTGYLLRERDENGALNLRAMDYHTRPEVYFPGYGWVEFEATPIPEPINIEREDRALSAAIADVVPAGGDDGSALDMALNEADSSSEAQNQTADVISPEGWVDDASVLPPVAQPWQAFLKIGGIVASLLLLFVLIYRWLKRFGNVDDPAKVYARLCRLASLVKLRPYPHLTPLEYCARLATALPAQADDISNITWAYLKSEFGKKNLGQEGKERLRQSWRVVYRTLLKRITHRSGTLS